MQAKVAIKLVNRGVSNAKAAEREIANLRLCGLHPYIIHMREVLSSTELSTQTLVPFLLKRVEGFIMHQRPQATSGGQNSVKETMLVDSRSDTLEL